MAFLPASRPVMRSNDPRHVDGTGRRFADDVAVAQHREPIGDREQLLETMRDVDDRHAVPR